MTKKQMTKKQTKKKQQDAVERVRKVLGRWMTPWSIDASDTGTEGAAIVYRGKDGDPTVVVVLRDGWFTHLSTRGVGNLKGYIDGYGFAAIEAAVAAQVAKLISAGELEAFVDWLVTRRAEIDRAKEIVVARDTLRRHRVRP